MNDAAPVAATTAADDASSSWWKKLGPGLITGAADDDPSGIVTYSQGGARFGYDIGWTLLLTYLLMVGSAPAQASSAINSISTQAPIGIWATPNALRACWPASPKT